MAGAFLCAGLAAAVAWKARGTPATWCFIAGMALLAGESVAEGMALRQSGPAGVGRWFTGALGFKALLPSVWLAFGLAYSRGDYRRYLKRSGWVLAAALLVPVALVATATLSERSFEVKATAAGSLVIQLGPLPRVLNLFVMLTIVMVLANLEKTFRGAVGTMQWRIKYTVLGLGVIFGSRVYIECQGMLFSALDENLLFVKAVSVLIGCTMLVVAAVRHGFSRVDVFLSSGALQTSVTVMLAGVYLFVVGVLAQAASFVGGLGNFRLQALVILLGVALLAILLLSDRLRQKLRAFVSRHFHRPQHDSRAIWTQFTKRLSTAAGRKSYCEEAVKLVSETFQALSVNLLLFDRRAERLAREASTSEVAGDEEDAAAVEEPEGLVLPGLRAREGPFDLEKVNEPWAEALKRLAKSRFPNGGNRMCVPLRAGGQELGAVVLADRVNAVPYSEEEMDLLKCIGDQVAAGLLQIQLTEELMRGREMEAFQAMSTFFVHDLKNAAYSLGLMLKNLPVHFDNPEFRQDALRGIAGTVNRINQIIERLGTLRRKLDLRPVPLDLASFAAEHVSAAEPLKDVQVVQDLRPVPSVSADPEHLGSVLTNLLINAREAVGPDGVITVRTCRRDDRAVLSVEDNGCGMTAEFIKDGLFRPFYTTKKKGLGIGMFQSRMIVEAHRGVLQVESAPGRGSVFRVILPLLSEDT